MNISSPVEVLLTHSYHLYYDRKQAERQQPYPPLGTIYAAALVREAGFSVAIFDTMIDDPDEGFERALAQYKPRVVVVCEDSFNFLSKMCLSRMREVSFKMREQAAKIGIPILVHGSDSSDQVETYLNNGFQAVLLGECEQSLVELLNALLRNGQNANWKIPGLAYLTAPDGKLTFTAARPRSTDLDQYPFPARDMVAIDRYSAIWRTHHGRSSTNLVASRGCPFHCNWCAKPIYGNKFLLRSAESVAQEMQLLKHQYGVEHLWFADDIFALNRRWVIEFADAVERRDAAIPFKIQSRADLMTSETVAALKRAGCEEIWMEQSPISSHPQRDGQRTNCRLHRGRAATARRCGYSRGVLSPVWLSGRNADGNRRDDRSRPPVPTGRYRSLCVIPASGNCVSSTRAGTAWGEAQLDRQPGS